MIVNYFEIGSDFELTPAEALAYFDAKGYKTSFNWWEMLGQDHDIAFTVAKMMNTDLLTTVKNELDKAIANGTTLHDFKRNLIPTLQKKGWWGKKDVIDPATGHIIEVQLGSASRLETIFKTNIQSSYAAGHWQSIEDNKALVPYLMYDAVDDDKTRADHAKLDGLVLPVDHEFWNTHYPPNGWGCRCGVIQMDEDDLIENGLTVSQSAPTGSKLWTNPNTGKQEIIPEGVDPGFVHNAGKAQLAKLQQLEKEKIVKLPPKEGAASLKATQATRAKAKDTKAQIIAAAKAELELIKAGKATKQAKLKQTILTKAQQSGAASELAPDELLEKVTKEAAEKQAKAEQASVLSGYKQKILSGKIPTAKQIEVFNSLSEAQQNKILIDIEKKQAKIARSEPLDVDMDKLVLIANKKKGSNPGAFYQDTETGRKYYIKTLQSEAHVKNEILASKLYNEAGIDAAELYQVKGHNNRVASLVIENIEENKEKLLSGKIANIEDGFAVDAWLANWDTVGLEFDNLVIKGNKAIRLDVGGSLNFRAQGGLKGDLFGNKVTEIDTLLNPKINPQSAEVFKNITDDKIVQSAQRVINIDDKTIKDIVSKYAYGSAAEKTALANKLIARKLDLKARYGQPSDKIMSHAQATKAIKTSLGELESQAEIPNYGSRDAFRNVTEAHMRAMYLYTKEHYYGDINRALFTRNVKSDQKPFINLLSEALANSDKYVGQTSRGIALYGDTLKRWISEHTRAMKENKPVRHLAFSSATIGDTPAFKKNVRLVIHGKTGVHIQPISHYGLTRENEVLYNKGTTYKVSEVITDDPVYGITIVLIEVPDTKIDRSLEFKE